MYFETERVIETRGVHVQSNTMQTAVIEPKNKKSNQSKNRKKNRDFKWIGLVFGSLSINQSNPIQTEIFILLYIYIYIYIYILGLICLYPL